MQTIPLHFFADGRGEEGLLQIKCVLCDVTIPLTERINSISEVDRMHYSLKADCPFMRGKLTMVILFKSFLTEFPSHVDRRKYM